MKGLAPYLGGRAALFDFDWQVKLFGYSTVNPLHN
jgi:hypothetical protein